MRGALLSPRVEETVGVLLSHIDDRPDDPEWRETLLAVQLSCLESFAQAEMIDRIADAFGISPRYLMTLLGWPTAGVWTDKAEDRA